MQLGVDFTFDIMALKVIVHYKQVKGWDELVHNVWCNQVARGPQPLVASKFVVQVNTIFWDKKNNIIYVLQVGDDGMCMCKSAKEGNNRCKMNTDWEGSYSNS